MHDGSTLTAYDVAYSISARAQDQAATRGASSDMYGASASDNLTRSTSPRPRRTLHAALSADRAGDKGRLSTISTRPVGTGPYMYVEGADYRPGL